MASCTPKHVKAYPGSAEPCNQGAADLTLHAGNQLRPISHNSECILMLDSIVAATGNEILRNPMVLFLENLKQEQSMQVQKDKFRSRHHEFEITIRRPGKNN